MNSTLDLMSFQFSSMKNNNSVYQQRFSSQKMSEHRLGNSMFNLTRTPLLDSRSQVGPTATSTPNPIQQQTSINHDILTNLFFKFDPNLFQKKEHLNFILASERDTRAAFPPNQPDHSAKKIDNQLNANNSKKLMPTHSDREEQKFVHVRNNMSLANYSVPRSNDTLHLQRDSLNESGSSDEQNDGKSYKCPHCFKLFRKKVHLNQHIRIHSGEKPYGCDFCEKRFTQLSHLWQHTRRHTGERPYKCDIGTCDKTFTQLSNLQSHIKTHGVQATSSAVEQVALANSTSVVHQRMMNKTRTCNKRHYCELCHKRFATEGVIRQHQCMRQSNAFLERTSDGALILKLKQ